jgi:hypothetical protein
MINDIEKIDNADINLDEIGKYGKFINFVKIPKEYNMVLFPANIPFLFNTNELVKEKLSKEERFSAMKRMKECLDKKIEDELKEDFKLKIKEKYNYKIMEKYLKTKLKSEEASSCPFCQPEPSP